MTRIDWRDGDPFDRNDHDWWDFDPEFRRAAKPPREEDSE